MMHVQPTARPSASQVIARITDAQTEHRYFCFSCIEAESGVDTYQPPDIVTGSLVRDYMHKDYADTNDNDDAEDTVTAKFLEEVGAVIVASQQELDSNSAKDATDNQGQDQHISDEKSIRTELGLKEESSSVMPVSDESGTEEQH